MAYYRTTTTAKIAARLKDLRTERGLSFTELSNAIAKDYGLKISDDSLRNYEVETGPRTGYLANLGMKAETLHCLADFYKVSTDYILGRTDTRSINRDVEAVTKATLLTEPAALALMSSLPVIAALDKLLTADGWFYNSLEALMKAMMFTRISAREAERQRPKRTPDGVILSGKDSADFYHQQAITNFSRSIDCILSEVLKNALYPGDDE